MDLARALLAAAVILLGSHASAAARDRVQPHPDFSGLWSTASLTTMERPDEFKALVATPAEAAAYEKAHRGKAPDLGPNSKIVGGPESEWWELDVGLARIHGEARTSWIVSPADGQRPFTATAKAANKARRDAMNQPPDGPEARDADERCFAVDAAGPPLDNGGLNDNYQFVQTADHLAIHAEWMDALRIVRLARPGAPAPHHPSPDVRLPMGDSVGHWEGETLVIETTNFRPQDVRAPNGDRAADMRVVEWLTRLSPSEVLYAFSVTNPARYTQTWSAQMLLHTTKGPIYEYASTRGTMACATSSPARAPKSAKRRRRRPPHPSFCSVGAGTAARNLDFAAMMFYLCSHVRRPRNPHRRP